MDYQVILTQIGMAKLANAITTGIPLNLLELAVGDGDDGQEYEPNDAQTELKNEVWRGDINRISIYPGEDNWILVEGRIPPEDGGFSVREVGIFDDEGDMIAIGNYPTTGKSTPGSGAPKDLYIKLIMAVSNASVITLQIDTSVVMATQEYVAESLATLDWKESVRVVTTGNMALAGLSIADGIQLAEGDRVLVRNQTIGAQNGIYVAHADAWSRAGDADTSEKVTSGQMVVVEEGALYQDSMWMLTTNAPITLGVTSLIYELFWSKDLRTQVDGARGSKASIDARLDVALNEDGTLKTGADAEVVAARGSLASLDARLDIALNDDGKFKVDSLALDYVLDIGTANNYVVNLNPAIAALIDGLRICFSAANDNTGACLLNVNGFGNKSLKDAAGLELIAGQIRAGQIVTAVYYSGEWRVTSKLDTPAGDIKSTARATADPGWLLCDGGAISRTTYATLFAAIGTAFGAGDGATTFNKPDLRGRTPIGIGQGAGLTNRALAGQVGAETHALVSAENGPHTHSVSPLLSDSGTNRDMNNGSAAGFLATTTGSSGNGQAHNNMQPSLAVNFIIKA